MTSGGGGEVEGRKARTCGSNGRGTAAVKQSRRERFENQEIGWEWW